MATVIPFTPRVTSAPSTPATASAVAPGNKAVEPHAQHQADLGTLAEQALQNRPASGNPAKAVPRAGLFQSFAQVCAFQLPDPQWVSEDYSVGGYSPQDEAAVKAFFDWFGVPVNPNASPVGQGEAWAWLIGEFGPAAAWQQTAPATFRAMCGGWPESKLSYLAALVEGNQAAARQLAAECGVALAVAEKLRAVPG